MVLSSQHTCIMGWVGCYVLLRSCSQQFCHHGPPLADSAGLAFRLTFLQIDQAWLRNILGPGNAGACGCGMGNIACLAVSSIPLSSSESCSMYLLCYRHNRHMHCSKSQHCSKTSPRTCCQPCCRQASCGNRAPMLLEDSQEEEAGLMQPGLPLPLSPDAPQTASSRPLRANQQQGSERNLRQGSGSDGASSTASQLGGGLAREAVGQPGSQPAAAQVTSAGEGRSLQTLPGAQPGDRDGQAVYRAGQAADGCVDDGAQRGAPSLAGSGTPRYSPVSTVSPCRQHKLSMLLSLARLHPSKLPAPHSTKTWEPAVSHLLTHAVQASGIISAGIICI